MTILALIRLLCADVPQTDMIALRSSNQLSLEIHSDATGVFGYVSALVVRLTLANRAFLSVQSLPFECVTRVCSVNAPINLSKAAFPLICGENFVVTFNTTNINPMVWYVCGIFGNAIQAVPHNLTEVTNGTVAYECVFAAHDLNKYGICDPYNNETICLALEFNFYPMGFDSVEFPTTSMQLYRTLGPSYVRG